MCGGRRVAFGFGVYFVYLPIVVVDFVVFSLFRFVL